MTYLSSDFNFIDMFLTLGCLPQQGWSFILCRMGMSLESISLGEGRKKDYAEEGMKLECNCTKDSTSVIESPRARLALQSYPAIQQGSHCLYHCKSQSLELGCPLGGPMNLMEIAFLGK